MKLKKAFEPSGMYTLAISERLNKKEQIRLREKSIMMIVYPERRTRKKRFLNGVASMKGSK